MANKHVGASLVGARNNLRMEKKFKKTPAGEIPVEWEVVNLRQICKVITKGTTPTTYGFKFTDAGVRFIKIENITESGDFIFSNMSYISDETNKVLQRSILNEGDILFSIAGALGRTAVVPKNVLPANTNQALAIIRIDQDMACVNYLRYFLGSDYIQNMIKSIAVQSAQSNLSLSQIGDFLVLIPSMIEQHKIAEILSSVDEAIEKVVAVIEKTKQLKKGLMQKLLTRGLGHKKFKKTELGKIPSGWEVENVKAVAKGFLNGGTPDTKVQSYWQGAIPWITGADIVDQKVSNVRRKITEEAVKNSATNVVPKGALIVVTRTGVGKLAIAPFNVAVSQDITGVIPDTQKVTTEFLFWFLDYNSNKLKSIHQGTSINGILREDLEVFQIPVPHLSEQKEIAEILSNVDVEIAREELFKQQLEQTKKSLMQVLLTGKVRVNCG